VGSEYLSKGIGDDVGNLVSFRCSGVSWRKKLLQSVRQIEAADFSNGTMAAKLKDFCHLLAEPVVIEKKTSEIR
jgi:hypothetical protein